MHSSPLHFIFRLIWSVSCFPPYLGFITDYHIPFIFVSQTKKKSWKTLQCFSQFQTFSRFLGFLNEMPRGPENIYYCFFVESVNDFHQVRPFGRSPSPFSQNCNNIYHCDAPVIPTGSHRWQKWNTTTASCPSLHTKQSCWHLLPMMWWSQSELWPCALWGSKMDGGGGRRVGERTACNCEENMLLFMEWQYWKEDKPKSWDRTSLTQKSTTLHSKTMLFLFKMAFAGQMTHSNHHVTDVHNGKCCYDWMESTYSPFIKITFAFFVQCYTYYRHSQHNCISLNDIISKLGKH